ncbi:DUF6279 family lipoprotein [Thiomicrorhabdus aquaedulcis]|uniref:DUF6279 family lipoprotein n=1 Tax=Thiomicrorhabdus aquaedulcis TaxID=2211106 RepID=UPI000FD7A415|nr:DUF6279 family lipoprotein [Thiomicrorhabdus aquaedulcis]
MTLVFKVWQKWLLLTVLVTLMSGCTVKLVYNQLDWLTAWYLDDFVRLTPEQTQLFESRLTRFLEWHRQQALPHYADFFEDIAKASDDYLSVAELQAFQTQLEGFLDQALLQVSNPLTDVMFELDDAQIIQLQGQFFTVNQEYQSKFIDISQAEQRSVRAEKMQRFIERFSGDLTLEQVEKITQWSQEFPLMGADFLHSRMTWESHFMAILHTRNNQLSFKESVSSLLLNRKAHQSPEQQSKFSHNQKRILVLLSELSKSFNAKQKQTFKETLLELADDARALSRQ